MDERGYIPVDKQMRTNVAHIFAIGDVVGQPMLAHKAVHEGRVAAEAAAGKNSFFDAKVIPSVAYTDPEVAWVGPTENELKAKGVKYGKGVFPWAASGRSLSLGRDEGITKILFDETTDRILGCGIVGPSAGDLIAEAALAIEMGADAEDIGLTIHPHPTLSETVGMAAEAFEGTITDLYMPKRDERRGSHFGCRHSKTRLGKESHGKGDHVKMDEHLVQSALNYHRFPNPGKISITPTMSMVNQRNLALAYCWECGLDTVRMHSYRDNETDEEAASPESLLIEEEELIWANIPAVGATSRVGT